GTPNTPENRLSNFADVNNLNTTITTLGNPNLQNEISETWTFGFLFQPSFAPGLSVSADRLHITLQNALTSLQATDFANACEDTPGRPAQYCGTLSYDQQGNIVGGIATTVNAGRLVYYGDVYNISYNTDLGSIF